MIDWALLREVISHITGETIRTYFLIAGIVLVVELLLVFFAALCLAWWEKRRHP